MAAWAIVSLGELWPLDEPLSGEQLDGWQNAIGIAGVALYGFAAVAYARLYRRRHARFAFATALSFGLLAEAMVVIAFARNWKVSWWEWHVLMLAALVLVALAARSEWHEERFSAIYLDKTLAGVQEASILFADLQGYTSFTERSGPEAAHELVMSYFERLVPLMESHGGDVHQLIGDAIMVILNKNGDQPDHADARGARGAGPAARGGRGRRRRPEWPRFRVGVNSGTVVAAVIGARERPPQARSRRRHRQPGRPAREHRARRLRRDRRGDVRAPPARRGRRAPRAARAEGEERARRRVSSARPPRGRR